MGLTSGGVFSQLHNVTLALELLKDEGLLDYPVDPKGERGVPVGAAVSGTASVGVVLLGGVGDSHDGECCAPSFHPAHWRRGPGGGAQGAGDLGVGCPDGRDLEELYVGGSARRVQGRTGWDTEGGRAP